MTHTIGDIHNKFYNRALVVLPPIHKKLVFQIRELMMELDGFAFLNLSFLDHLDYDQKEIRSNLPKTNVPLSGIIGAYILPSVYKPGWSFANPIVGNSVFGAFLSGTISKNGIISSESPPHSVNCLVSSKNKSFQLELELIINNHFEFDNTKKHEKTCS